MSKTIGRQYAHVLVDALDEAPTAMRITLLESRDPLGRNVRVWTTVARDRVILERDGFRPVAVAVADLMLAMCLVQEPQPIKPTAAKKKGGRR